VDGEWRYESSKSPLYDDAEKLLKIREATWRMAFHSRQSLSRATI